jgi:hypothetical protein
MATEREVGNQLKFLRQLKPYYTLTHNYYSGRHRMAYASEKFRNAFGDLFMGFSDNICPGVIDAVADRLHIDGFEVDGCDASLKEDARIIWRNNTMPVQSGFIHNEALKSGDAYLIVWPDKAGNPVMFPNRPDLVSVSYNEEVPGLIDWAIKCWRRHDGYWRLNVYYADRIEKYLSISRSDQQPEQLNKFQPLVIPDEAWPLPNPYGRVPVFAFSNCCELGGMGTSELQSVIPLQDALNKAMLDLLVAMEFVALPQRWATGLEVDIDPETGEAIQPFKPGVDRIWTVADTEVTFGEFQQANLEQFIKVQDSLRIEAARITGTPLHYMMLLSDPPSGESLKTLEVRLVKKVKDRIEMFGAMWAQAMNFALMITGKEVGTGTMKAKWCDPAPQTPREQSEVGVLKSQVGISNAQIQREMGYTDDQIETMKEEVADQVQAAGATMLKQFDKGTGGGNYNG